MKIDYRLKFKVVNLNFEENFDNISEDLFNQEPEIFNRDEFYEDSMRKAIEAKSSAFQKLDVLEDLAAIKEEPRVIEGILRQVIKFQEKMIYHEENTADSEEETEQAIDLMKSPIVMSSPELIGRLLRFFFSVLPIHLDLRCTLLSSHAHRIKLSYSIGIHYSS